MTSCPPSVAAPDAAAKARLRRDALDRRDGIDEASRAAAAAALARFADRLELPAGAIVAGYWPIRSEIDCRPLMAALAATGHLLALPAVLADGETTVFRPHVPGGVLEPAAFGLSVPPAAAGEVAPDVLLMPLAAFDRAGHRIGYGKGHYDRALARLEATRPRRKIGLAFALQEIAAVPAEAHDRRLDLILTERGPIVPTEVP